MLSTHTLLIGRISISFFDRLKPKKYPKTLIILISLMILIKINLSPMEIVADNSNYVVVFKVFKNTDFWWSNQGDET